MENYRNENDNLLTESFRDRNSAEQAYNRLIERGYTDDQINIIMSDETRKKNFDKHKRNESEFGNKSMEGAGTGSAIGGAVGAVVGIIAAIGTSIVIPGLGIVVSGPIAAGLAGAGAGGITGGIVGALVGGGIPEKRAKEYEKDINDGHIIMGVRPHSEEDASYLEDNWRQREGEDIYR
jgi:hypothetical protein